MSLLIKITQNGSSQEYIFTKLGPIIIGSDSRSDIRLEDSHIEPKMLEVKMSGGNVYVKELGSRSQIYLNSVILPFREEILYHDGECISLKDTNYQIHIQKIKSETIDPPPFFEGEFKERLEKMNFKISEKENELKGLEEVQGKKEAQLSDLKETYYKHAAEKSKLEVEITGLRSQKDVLALDVRKTSDEIQDEEGRVSELRDFVKRLENEERSLNTTIVSQNMILAGLKDERKNKEKEVDQQRLLLASFHIDNAKLETQLKELSQEQHSYEEEILLENSKVERILHTSEAAKRENARIQNSITQLLKEKALLDHDVKDLQTEVVHLESARKETYNKLQEMKKQVDVCENQSLEIHQKIQRHLDNETNLRNLNGELHTELVKVEEKLSLKKNQLNQVDFQGQDATRKLTTVTFELERASLHLKELYNEEKAQELKMIAIRDDLQAINKRATEDKKLFQKNSEDEKSRLGLQLSVLQNEIECAKNIILQVQVEEGLLKTEIDDLHSRYRGLSKDKQTLEVQFSELQSQKSKAEAHIQLLKEETLKFEQEKNRTQREFSHLQMKMMDSETQNRERHEEASLALEQFKREERAKMIAEKTVYLSEVEAFKQKSLIEVECEYRKKQDALYQEKLLVQASADEILREARLAELAITGEATGRLKKATLEAQEREVQSHNRIKEAQEYFKVKELEADAIIQRSRLDSRDYLKKTEAELMSDLSKRKQKIKQFLTMKQEVGLAHIKAMTEQHVQKMSRDDEKAQQRREEIKRKELKRIARLRDEELSTQNVMKDEMLKSLKAEKEKTLHQIHELRKVQEAELADKRKTVLEHINSSKFTQQQTWGEELKREKEEFARSKKARIQNATSAVMNVLVAEIGGQGENEQALKDKILMTLEMAIDGQNAAAMKEVNQILDYNPLKRKKIVPVLKKYAWQVGVPAALAIILLGDIGSARTLMVDGAKNLMRQRHSASEIYVNQQKSDWVEKNTFNPETTVGYKPTYTENILYTTNFEKIMENEEFQNDWILKVHDFLVKDLELSEDLAINYISAEGTLLKDLAVARKDLHPSFLEAGLKKLNDLEKTHLGWLVEKIPDPIKMEKFANFRKAHFDKHYNEVFLKNRDVASEIIPVVTPMVTPMVKP